MILIITLGCSQKNEAYEAHNIRHSCNLCSRFFLLQPKLVSSGDDKGHELGPSPCPLNSTPSAINWVKYMPVALLVQRGIVNTGLELVREI